MEHSDFILLFEFLMDRSPMERESERMSAFTPKQLLDELRLDPSFRAQNIKYPSDYIGKYASREMALRAAHVEAVKRHFFGGAEDFEYEFDETATVRDFRNKVMSNPRFMVGFLDGDHSLKEKIAIDADFPRTFADLSRMARETASALDAAVDLTRIGQSGAFQRSRFDRLKRKIARICRSEGLRIAICTKETYAGVPEKHVELPNGTIKSYRSPAEFLEDEASFKPDLFIIGNNQISPDSIDRIWTKYLDKDTSPIGLIWNYDNHHSFDVSLQKTGCFDIVVPGHPNFTDYILLSGARLLSFVPCGVGQWPQDLIAERFDEFNARDRSNLLDGGFVLYEGRNSFRNGLIETLQESGIPNCIRGARVGSVDYWKNTPVENLAEWMKYKVSICLPVNNDIPIRLFDALAAGQIPIVPAWIDGLDQVLPVAEQERLPVVKFYDDTVDEIERAYRTAIRLFDQGGAQAAAERSRYCLNTHMFSHRYTDILAKLLQMFDALQSQGGGTKS